jgi:hypothetical protein
VIENFAFYGGGLPRARLRVVRWAGFVLRPAGEQLVDELVLYALEVAEEEDALVMQAFKEGDFAGARRLNGMFLQPGVDALADAAGLFVEAPAALTIAFEYGVGRHLSPDDAARGGKAWRR